MGLDALTGMEVFRQAVERGSLAAAARFCALSPEMAGRHLRALEQRLGARLLNRSTRRLNLTPAGERYYGRCVAILEEVRVAETEVAAGSGRPSGRLRIAAPLAFGSAVLVGPIATYAERFPDVTVDLSFSERNVDMLAEGYDLLLRLGELGDSALLSRRLANYRLLLVASPDFVARHPPAVRPSDLPLSNALIYTQTRVPDSWRFVRDDGAVEEVALTGQIRASDIAFLLALAVNGRGLALLPDFAVRGHLDAGRLLELMPAWRERTLPLFALFPHRTLVPATVREMIDLLARCLPQA